jgi:hypothetical protein
MAKTRPKRQARKGIELSFDPELMAGEFPDLNKQTNNNNNNNNNSSCSVASAKSKKSAKFNKQNKSNALHLTANPPSVLSLRQISHLLQKDHPKIHPNSCARSAAQCQQAAIPP